MRVAVESMLMGSTYTDSPRITSTQDAEGGKPLVGHWRCRLRIHNAFTLAGRASRGASRDNPKSVMRRSQFRSSSGEGAVVGQG